MPYGVVPADNGREHLRLCYLLYTTIKLATVESEFEFESLVGSFIFGPPVRPPCRLAAGSTEYWRLYFPDGRY